MDTISISHRVVRQSSMADQYVNRIPHEMRRLNKCIGMLAVIARHRNMLCASTQHPGVIMADQSECQASVGKGGYRRDQVRQSR